MKSKLVTAVVVALLSAAVWRSASLLTQAPSLKEELVHLVALRDGGFISSREYKRLKRHVLNRMLR